MAEECTDIGTIEEHSLFSLGGKWRTCWAFFWHHFIKESWCCNLSIQLWLTGSSRRVFSLLSLSGWDLMEQQTFSEARTGVQERLRRILLELAMFTAIATYFNLLVFKLQTSLHEMSMSTRHCSPYRIFFHYSPKRVEHLKCVQRVVEIPEVKVTKLFNTHFKLLQ